MRRFVTSRISSYLHARGVEVRRATRCSGMDPLADLAKLGGDAASVRTILDVGANVGQSALRFAAAFPSAAIHSFEPCAESHAAGVAATAAEPRVTWHATAVGDRNGTASFYADGTNQTASLAAPDGGASRASFTERAMPLVRLDDFCAREGIGRVDLLKTDTEGFDLDVLKGAERLLAAGAVRFVLCEVGFAQADLDHSPFGAIAAFLERFGLRLAHFYGVSDVAHFRHWGCCYADALFAQFAPAPAAMPFMREAVPA